ncbi:hypothetical protein DOTSEDRAFT_40634 [Dothistroma septosporum NZE10]|uniref:C2H2-type domain-containing protein n=1 Tax=Dothistroma septosporum (strain NZE10 / CBS 128990) TaxID=675120 RepID=N1Q400_DOTSN|nr:hypothetical protein DOTSEDRAFT_40634 [Dothistroma septosporum NZE10]
MTATNNLYIDQEGPIAHADHLPLEEAKPRRVSSESIHPPESSIRSRSTNRDPGPDVLGLGLGPGPARSGSLSPDDYLLDLGHGAMTHPVAPKPLLDTEPLHANRIPKPIIAFTSTTDASAGERRDKLRNTAALAVEQSETQSPSPSNTIELASRPAHRVDSAQESVPQVSKHGPSEKGGSVSALTVKTSMQPPAIGDAQDSIAHSPTLRKHVIQVGESSAHTLPAVHSTSPTTGTATNSRRKESLPSFRQLADLADIASQQSTTSEARSSGPARQHSHSVSSTTSQSPMAAYVSSSYPHSAQAAPAGFSTFARSPTSAVSEVSQYGSPAQYHNSGYYIGRRSSNATVGAPNFPPAVPSLPSGSSTESHGTQASSSTDGGYSTSHTTPIEGPGHLLLEGIARPILPPLLGMPVPMMPAGPFKCDYPGCNAVAFQTQYLLSSHRNVHSQVRPHYCPVRECPRSEGGKGFKRKNEMIRHGLVHSSPGYVCPFCPDREHRYPRPDNLQRWVLILLDYTPALIDTRTFLDMSVSIMSTRIATIPHCVKYWPKDCRERSRSSVDAGRKDLKEAVKSFVLRHSLHLATHVWHHDKEGSRLEGTTGPWLVSERTVSGTTYDRCRNRNEQ